ncbi:DUF6891 domain-containing protein [Brachybacterium hainanense]|uniref:DUF6891 domain-containing protein n=1 Tax=Brachybacterium hainanense TaxID=1541174 RepID=A0ABV6R995_9MICO
MTEDEERAAILAARAERKAAKRLADIEHQEMLAELRLHALAELAIGQDELPEIREILREQGLEKGASAAEADEILDSAWRERRYLARENADLEHSAVIRAAFEDLLEQGILLGEDIGRDAEDGRAEMQEAARELMDELDAPPRGYVFFSREDTLGLVDGSDALRLHVGALPGSPVSETAQILRDVLAEHGIPAQPAADGVVIPEVAWFPSPPPR